MRAAGGEVLGTSVDCSICLESFEASADNWRLFPCAGHHGACAGCTADMVRCVCVVVGVVGEGGGNV